MTETLASLSTSVRDRIGDYAELHTLTFTASNARTRFRLRRNIDAGSLVVRVNGYEVTPAAVDAASGWVTLASAPSAGVIISFEFSYHKYAQSRVEEAINDALPRLWPEFYVPGSTDTLATTGSELEYAVPAACEVPLRVWLYAAGRWSERLDWEWLDEARLIHFNRQPGSYQMRLSYVGRPEPALTPANDIAALGLPDRARDPIVLFAGYQLLHGKIAVDELAEARSLRTQKTTIDATQAFLQAFAFSKAAVAMQPWQIGMQVSYG